jgi:hypothetical protein
MNAQRSITSASTHKILIAKVSVLWNKSKKKSFARLAEDYYLEELILCCIFARGIPRRVPVGAISPLL